MSSTISSPTSVNHQLSLTANPPKAADKDIVHTQLNHAHKPATLASHDKAAIGSTGTKVDTSA